MTPIKGWIVALLVGFGVLVGVYGAAAAVVLFGQEKPARATRQWQIGAVAGSWYSADVFVIDTDGVCLYVVVGAEGRGGIAAVPKTQLPPATGC